MALGFDNIAKVLRKVQLHEPTDGVILPVDPSDSALLLMSRRVNPAALGDVQQLQRNGVPPDRWGRSGNRVVELP